MKVKNGYDREFDNIELRLRFTADELDVLDHALQVAIDNHDADDCGYGSDAIESIKSYIDRATRE